MTATHCTPGAIPDDARPPNDPPVPFIFSGCIFLSYPARSKKRLCQEKVRGVSQRCGGGSDSRGVTLVGRRRNPLLASLLLPVDPPLAFGNLFFLPVCVCRSERSALQYMMYIIVCSARARARPRAPMKNTIARRAQTCAHTLRAAPPLSHLHICPWTPGPPPLRTRAGGACFALRCASVAARPRRRRHPRRSLPAALQVPDVPRAQRPGQGRVRLLRDAPRRRRRRGAGRR